MIRRDLAEVLAIESASFDYPWSEDEFLGLLRTRNIIGMSAEHADFINGRYPIIGYMLYQLEKTSITVLNFAVHPQYRHQGVGRQMVAKLISKLSAHRRTTLTLQVRETNLDAQLFWHCQGFFATEVVREAYETGEDGIRFEYAYRESAVECRGKTS
jgi:ribosomal-protein-alanine N-acetyltransferase